MIEKAYDHKMLVISCQCVALCIVNLNPTITHNSSFLREVHVSEPEPI